MHGTPPPLPYASPPPQARLIPPWFHFGIFLWSLLLVVAWMVPVILVMPRFEQTFQDFKMELPATTRALLSARRFALAGGFIVFLAIPVMLGFISGQFGPFGRRVIRWLVTLVFALLIGITVLGLFQPYVSLVEGMSGSR